MLLGIETCFFLFFFNDTASTEIYTLSLHDALPIFDHGHVVERLRCHLAQALARDEGPGPASHGQRLRDADHEAPVRSEEHTSELQSQSNLVCRLLLEKKKTTRKCISIHE